MNEFFDAPQENDDFVKIENTTEDIHSSRVISALKGVIDPDIHHNIYDMGLIYKINISEEKIGILMTFTTMSCPSGPSLINDVDENLRFEFPNHEIEIDVTFDPPWGIDRLPEYIKVALNILS